MLWNHRVHKLQQWLRETDSNSVLEITIVPRLETLIQFPGSLSESVAQSTRMSGWMNISRFVAAACYWRRAIALWILQGSKLRFNADRKPCESPAMTIQRWRWLGVVINLLRRSFTKIRIYIIYGDSARKSKTFTVLDILHFFIAISQYRDFLKKKKKVQN